MALVSFETWRGVASLSPSSLATTTISIVTTPTTFSSSSPRVTADWFVLSNLHSCPLYIPARSIFLPDLFSLSDPHSLSQMLVLRLSALFCIFF